MGGHPLPLDLKEAVAIVTKALSSGSERAVRKAVLNRVIVPAGCLCLMWLPAPAEAQDTTTGPHETTTSPPARETRPRPPTRIYFGMCTLHLRDDVVALDNNWAIGIASHGFFGATFLNSYGRRAYTTGLQRTIFSTEPALVGASLGFRLGLISGYDGRFMRIARDTPVLPLVQPFASVDVGHVGVEISYTFVIVSMAIAYKF
jgi:hypothetical protein